MMSIIENLSWPEDSEWQFPQLSACEATQMWNTKKILWRWELENDMVFSVALDFFGISWWDIYLGHQKSKKKKKTSWALKFT